MSRREGWEMRSFKCGKCGVAFLRAKWRKEQKYCSRKCFYAAQIVAPSERLNFKIDERGCHIWQGAIASTGYAVMSIMNRTKYVHAVVYEGKYGDVPASFEIDHLCRNRACINPDHLEAVSHAENCRRGARWPRDSCGRLLFGARKQPASFKGRKSGLGES